MAKVKNTFTLDPEAVVTLKKISDSNNVPVSTLLNSIILQKGVDMGILEMSDEKKSIYDEKEIKYNFTASQNKLDNLLAATSAKISDYAAKSERDISDLYHRLNDLEKMIYEVRDMVNILVNYSVPSDEKFQSADKDSGRDYYPSRFIASSDQLFEQKKERLATERASFERERKGKY